MEEGLHDMYFMISYLLKQKEYKYLSALRTDDYLSLRQRGSLEGMAENLYRQNSRSNANTSYGKTGTYDVASKMGLYNPATSVDVYSPKRNLYQKENDWYSV